MIGCGAATTGRLPRAPAPRAAASVQDLYEAGRYREVVEAVARSGGAVSPQDSWLAAQSYLRLERPEEAQRQFQRLQTEIFDAAWQAVGRLGLLQLNESADEFERAQVEASAYPAHPFVQYQLGLVLAQRGAFEEAARALDRCIESEPRFAYAYYSAGLMYQRLDRADLATTRLESFVRLAPNAPERPAVESVLRTMRGR